MHLLQTTGDKNDQKIVFMRKSQRTSQHGTHNAKTHDRTTQKTKRRSNTDSNKNPGVSTGACKKTPAMLLIKSSPVKVLAVIEERNIYAKSKKSIVI